MREFTFELSTKIYFGTAVTEEALKQERKWFQGKTMVVTTGGALARHGYLGELVAWLEGISLENSGMEDNIIVYENISRNPRLEEVQDAVRIGRAMHVGTVVGFGGGSAIDAAKAVAAGIPQAVDLEEYLLKGKEPTEDTLPVIAIPTTAGTGSELSKAAILSSQEHHIKVGIRGKYLLPKAAIVDARYTWTLPEKVTVETGFDVFAHAAESYLAVKANPFSEMLSEKAIRIVGENLPLLCRQPEKHEAREKMCFASMFMGINLANVGTCLPHRMQYPVGAATDTSHGAGLLALYPAWIQYEYDVNQKKTSDIIEWLTGERTESGQQARDGMERFLQKIKGNYTLRNLGITRDMAEDLSVQVTGNLKNDRLAGTPHVIREIFNDSM